MCRQHETPEKRHSGRLLGSPGAVEASQRETNVGSGLECAAPVRFRYSDLKQVARVCGGREPPTRELRIQEQKAARLRVGFSVVVGATTVFFDPVEP